jgi:hypothetical protein
MDLATDWRDIAWARRRVLDFAAARGGKELSQAVFEKPGDVIVVAVMGKTAAKGDGSDREQAATIFGEAVDDV